MCSRILVLGCALLFAALGRVPLLAQILMDPKSPQGVQLIQIFEADRAGKTKDTGPLKCEVAKLKPSLNFAFRYQAGYRVNLPLKQLSEDNRILVIAFKVTTLSGDAPGTPSPSIPVLESAAVAATVPRKESYFLQFLRTGKLPPETRAPKSRFEAVFDGGFFLGTGDYQVDFILQDGQAHTCRASWRIEHHPREGSVKEFLQPGEVHGFRLDRLASIESATPRPRRIAILLHAAPQFPRKSLLSGFDISMLLSSLSSLLEDSPFAATSVTAFSLQKQKEIFRTEKLDRASFRQLNRALEQIENATVDWTVLRNPKGQADLLVQLANRELAAANPPDAIIVMGPNSWNSNKVAAERLEKSTLSPPIFYIRHDLFPAMFPFRDTVEELTRAAGGKVFTVRGPKDLAEAMRKIEAELAPRAAQARP